MKPLLAGVLMAWCVSAHATPALVESLEIIPAKKESFASPTAILFKSDEVVRVDLELGDSLEDLILRLHPRKGLKADFVVEQSFETSLTVMQEGPHLDLLDWKHYQAPWQPLKKLSATDFRTRRISAADSEKFPTVTPEEIQAVVTREGGAQLGKYVSKVKGPNDYPCGVGISKVRFRIKVREGTEEKVIQTLEFLVPMGC